MFINICEIVRLLENKFSTFLIKHLRVCITIVHESKVFHLLLPEECNIKVRRSLF